MAWTRRTFLTAATGAAVVGLPGVALASGSRPLRRSTFTPLVGELLVATAGGRRHRVRLVHVRDVLGTPPGSQRSFALQLTSGHPLPDGRYVLRHPRAGRHDLFVSGVGQGTGRRYEAVVNRAVPATS